MFSGRRIGLLACLSLVTLGLTWHLATSSAQQPPAENDARETVAGSKFEFEVVESIDAEYLGDTPGHHGRNGGLGNRRPQLSLGDPVFRGSEQVGVLTQIVWDRTRGSLDLEFDPQPLVRINVGDMVWVALDGPQRAKPSLTDKSAPTR